MAKQKGKASKAVYPQNKPSKVHGKESGKGKTNNPNPKSKSSKK